MAIEVPPLTTEVFVFFRLGSPRRDLMHEESRRVFNAMIEGRAGGNSQGLLCGGSLTADG